MENSSSALGGESTLSRLQQAANHAFEALPDRRGFIRIFVLSPMLQKKRETIYLQPMHAPVGLLQMYAAGSFLQHRAHKAEDSRGGLGGRHPVPVNVGY